MVLVPENTLERLQQRQQILTPPVTQTLKNLDREMSDILSSEELDDEAKAKLYNQVLQRYLTYYDQRKSQPLHVKLTAVKPTETPKPEETPKPDAMSSEETRKEATAEAETTSAVEQEVIKSVPKLYKTGARQLLDKIKESRDVLNWNEKGELLYENKPISGSHVVDLVNDTLRHRKGFEPVGWSVFARGLARMNVPENIVRNPQRQSAIREFKARVREETPESPSRWLPTPPTTQPVALKALSHKDKKSVYVMFRKVHCLFVLVRQGFECYWLEESMAAKVFIPRVITHFTHLKFLLQRESL